MVYETFEIRNMVQGQWRIIPRERLIELLKEGNIDPDIFEESLSLGAAMISFSVNRWSEKLGREYKVKFQVRKHGGKYHAALVNARNYIKDYEYTLTKAQPHGADDYDEIVGIIENALLH